MYISLIFMMSSGSYDAIEFGRFLKHFFAISFFLIKFFISNPPQAQKIDNLKKKGLMYDQKPFLLIILGKPLQRDQLLVEREFKNILKSPEENLMHKTFNFFKHTFYFEINFKHTHSIFFRQGWIRKPRLQYLYYKSWTFIRGLLIILRLL